MNPPSSPSPNFSRRSGSSFPATRLYPPCVAFDMPEYTAAFAILSARGVTTGIFVIPRTAAPAFRPIPPPTPSPMPDAITCPQSRSRPSMSCSLACFAAPATPIATAAPIAPPGAMKAGMSPASPPANEPALYPLSPEYLKSSRSISCLLPSTSDTELPADSINPMGPLDLSASGLPTAERPYLPRLANPEFSNPVAIPSTTG